VQVVGELRPDNPSKSFTDIANRHNWCRTENLGNFTGSRGYYFLGELVELEQAIIQLVIQNLISRNFKLVTVPDILPAEAIENCGMPTKGERAQVKNFNYVVDICIIITFLYRSLNWMSDME
jgi:seryl-tRNA synthetase